MSKTKDILFPTNVFGKKRKIVSYDTDNAPRDTSMYPIINVTFDIQWSGEQIEILYGMRRRYGNPPNITETIKSRRKLLRDSQAYNLFEQINVSSIDNTQFVNNIMYFSCTNVTRLVVNGETLI